MVAAKSNVSRPNDSTDCVCSLDIPRRLAYEWHQSQVYCVAAVNESLKAKLLDECVCVCVCVCVRVSVSVCVCVCVCVSVSVCV